MGRAVAPSAGDGHGRELAGLARLLRAPLQSAQTRGREERALIPNIHSRACELGGISHQEEPV